MTIRRAIAAILRSWAQELEATASAPPRHPGALEVEAMLAERSKEVGESLASARLRRDIAEAQRKIFPITRKRELRALR